MAWPLYCYVKTHRAPITRSLSGTFLFKSSALRSSDDRNSASFALAKSVVSIRHLRLVDFNSFLVSTSHCEYVQHVHRSH